MEKKQKMNKKSVWKRVLHPNRYFIWAIIVIILGLGSLIAFIEISSINDSSSQIYSDLVPHNIYNNQKLGFSVGYPNGWVIDSGSQDASVISFDNPNDPNESISISSSTLASVAKFKKSSKIDSATSSERNGMQITIYEISSPEGTQPLKIAVIESAKKAYYISGQSASFMRFVNSFKNL
jgi:hypothetical protein